MQVFSITQIQERVPYYLLSSLRMNIFELERKDHFSPTLIFAITALGPVCSHGWGVKSVK